TGTVPQRQSAFERPRTGRLNPVGNGHNPVPKTRAKVAVVSDKKAQQAERIRVAKLKGYEGDPCPECGYMTMVRNGTCLKCESCGSTSGCS
ncbi:MAG TPA: hypothetical protein PKA06_15625, partial [Gemmatales bacterium]|nr:hypothetical protein [Gemmatales bacterium]